MERNTMRANTIALSALLLGAGLLGSVGAEATATQGYSPDPVLAVTGVPSDTLQLADGGKLNDRHRAGRTGGANGLGAQSRSGKSKSGKAKSGTSQGGTPQGGKHPESKRN
jgi:hypothetical protein